jgi:hypothetical protein
MFQEEMDSKKEVDGMHLTMFMLLPATLQSGYKMHDRILRAAKVIVYQ